MSTTYEEQFTEAEIDATIGALGRYGRAVAKAFLIAMMMTIAMATFSGLLWKPVAIGALIFLIACFNTWRRLLQPISFLAFLAAIAHICFDLTPAVNLISQRFS